MKYQTLLVIFIIAFISSAMLAWNASCNTDSCELNPDEKYFVPAKTTNGFIGMTIFLFMSLVTLSHIDKPTKNKKRIIHLGVIIGATIALYFLYLQQFVLQAYCKYCLVIDFGLLIAFTIAIFTWKK